MRISIRTIIRAVVCWMVMAFAANSSAEGIPEEATTLVERYFNALQSGDVSALDTILGGSLQARLQAMQGNADYALQLAGDNSASSFAVVESRQSDAGLIEVDYVVSDGDESIRKRIFLAPGGQRSQGYRIIAEQVIP
jgi:hypothetical protein